MIDCSKTENYFVEKKRMTKINKYCQIDCVDCPLNSSNSGIDIPCKSLEANYPDKAIEIVQKWSNEHPQKTLLSDFLKHYPQTELENGLPPLCAGILGQGDEECKHEFNECYSDCRDCWNASIEESEEAACGKF